MMIVMMMIMMMLMMIRSCGLGHTLVYTHDSDFRMRMRMVTTVVMAGLVQPV